MRLTIYSRPGCHLCDEMKAVVAQAIAKRAKRADHGDVTVEEVDISGDRALLDLYELEIPVLLVNGKKAAKYRITEAELLRRLAAW
jgi:glutaredoxin